MHIVLRYFNRNDAWAVNYFVSSYCAAVLLCCCAAVPFIQSIVILILVLITALVDSITLINATIFLAKKGTVTLLSLLS